MSIARETEEKGYDYCSVVIESCKTIEQLDGAKNLVENFLQIHGSNSMSEYLFLQNMIINKKIILDHETKNS